MHLAAVAVAVATVLVVVNKAAAVVVATHESDHWSIISPKKRKMTKMALEPVKAIPETF